MSTIPVCILFDDCFWASLEEGVRLRLPVWTHRWETLCEWGFQGQLKIFLPQEQFLRLERASGQSMDPHLVERLWQFARRTLGAVYASEPTFVFRETQVVNRLSTFFCDEEDVVLPCELKPLSWLQASELSDLVRVWKTHGEAMVHRSRTAKQNETEQGSRHERMHAVVRDLVQKLYGVDESKDVHAMVSLTLRDAGWRWTYAPSFASYLEALLQDGDDTSFSQRVLEGELASWLPMVDVLQVSDTLHRSMQHDCAHRPLTHRLVSSSDAARTFDLLNQKIRENLAAEANRSESPNSCAVVRHAAFK